MVSNPAQTSLNILTETGQYSFNLSNSVSQTCTLMSGFNINVALQQLWQKAKQFWIIGIEV